MSDEKKRPRELEELLAWWKAGEATGAFDSRMTSKSMIAILTELTRRKSDD